MQRRQHQVVQGNEYVYKEAASREATEVLEGDLAGHQRHILVEVEVDELADLDLAVVAVRED